MKNQVKVKICGLTQEKEADYLNEAGADFAGTVLFFPKSKRNTSIEQAKKIVERLNTSIKSVAVVVSPSVDEVRQIENAGFDFIQIHGELSDDVLEAVSIPVLKAFHSDEAEQYTRYQMNDKVKGYVFDAAEPGSGKTFDWSSLNNIERSEKYFILAGGLNGQNVSDAIQYLHPDIVDVSTGVEDEDGRKSKEKIKEFVQKAKRGMN